MFYFFANDMSNFTSIMTKRKWEHAIVVPLSFSYIIVKYFMEINDVVVRNTLMEEKVAIMMEEVPLLAKVSKVSEFPLSTQGASYSGTKWN